MTRAKVLVPVLVCTLVFLVTPAVAQEETSSVPNLDIAWQPGVTSQSGLRNLMLIDPSRLTISRSVTMSYGMGSGYGSSGSAVTGLFLNHVNYRISDPVQVWVDVGVGYHPSLEMDGQSGAEVVVPGFGLLYQPSDRFRLEVSVQNPRYYYHPYGYSPYNMWRR